VLLVGVTWGRPGSGSRAARFRRAIPVSSRRAASSGRGLHLRSSGRCGRAVPVT